MCLEYIDKWKDNGKKHIAHMSAMLIPTIKVKCRKTDNRQQSYSSFMIFREWTSMTDSAAQIRSMNIVLMRRRDSFNVEATHDWQAINQPFRRNRFPPYSRVYKSTRKLLEIRLVPCALNEFTQNFLWKHSLCLVSDERAFHRGSCGPTFICAPCKTKKLGDFSQGLVKLVSSR